MFSQFRYKQHIDHFIGFQHSPLVQNHLPKSTSNLWVWFWLGISDTGLHTANGFLSYGVQGWTELKYEGGGRGGVGAGGVVWVLVTRHNGTPLILTLFNCPLYTVRNILLLIVIDLRRVSSGFYHLWERQFMQFSFLGLIFSYLFLGITSLRMPINRKRKQRSENETEITEIITWTAVG